MNPTSPPTPSGTPEQPAAPAPASTTHPSGGQNKPAPASPRDGADNQGGIRRQGDDYLRDIGTEQDA